jgi:hypothetical protein
MMRTESSNGHIPLARAKRIMLRIALASIAGRDENIPPLPLAPDAGEKG